MRLQYVTAIGLPGTVNQKLCFGDQTCPNTVCKYCLISTYHFATHMNSPACNFHTVGHSIDLHNFTTEFTPITVQEVLEAK
jgi:hypothetical protein